jgi:hypothetical protein
MNSVDRNRLLDKLITLETKLHRVETRRNRQRMEALLHPDFIEIGRSGRVYTRAEILEEFGTDSVLPAIHASHFDLVVLADGVALLTYRSAHVDADGNLQRHTLRSSVWVSTKAGWQMRFHQGTPTTGEISASRPGDTKGVSQ